VKTHMTTTLLLLLLAALLEAGGDALVRSGLRGAGANRWVWMLAGGVVLFAYGCAVNTPAWDFGRLLGIYVVFFFVVAQLISWIAFHQKPDGGVWAGGALIVLGGIVLSVWRR
jgi:drug/metabolite transporter superfamily protein YnfA